MVERIVIPEGSTLTAGDYEDFLQGVAIGRNTTVGTVKNDCGEGRMLDAERAKAAGMIDGIATLDELLAGLMKPKSTTRRSRANSIAIARARTSKVAT